MDEIADFFAAWAASAGAIWDAAVSSPAWYLPAAALFCVVVCGLWLLNAVMLPGNWAIAVAAAGWVWLMPAEGWGRGFGWWTVAALFALAAGGEILEALAGVAGSSKAGGSKRAAALSIVGAAGGSLLGASAGVPIPVIGPLIGAVLFGALGAFAGAYLGETWKGRTSGESVAVGTGAFWGKLWGTLGRLACGAVMVAVVSILIWLPHEAVTELPDPERIAPTEIIAPDDP